MTVFDLASIFYIKLVFANMEIFKHSFTFFILFPQNFTKGISIYNFYNNVIKRGEIHMKWENQAIISETLIDRLPAQSYKSDYKFDFERKSIGSEMVQGLEAFIQKFKRVLLTPKTPKTYYELADSLPNSLNQEEFNKQSE